jgi:hypothetical protein
MHALIRNIKNLPTPIYYYGHKYNILFITKLPLKIMVLCPRFVLLKEASLKVEICVQPMKQRIRGLIYIVLNTKFVIWVFNTSFVIYLEHKKR